MTGLKISEVTSPLDVEQARDIRRSVLCGELNWPREVADDPADLEARLFLASLGPKPLGSARLIQRKGAWHIEALAVLRPFRGLGVGKALLKALEQAAAGPLCSAPQAGLEPFFEHCGYAARPGDDASLLWKNG